MGGTEERGRLILDPWRIDWIFDVINLFLSQEPRGKSHESSRE